MEMHNELDIYRRDLKSNIIEIKKVSNVENPKYITPKNKSKVNVYMDNKNNRLGFTEGHVPEGFKPCNSYLFLFHIIKSVPHVLIPTISDSAPKFKGLFDFSTSGMLDEGETFHDCVVRRAKEELNIDISHERKKPIAILDTDDYSGHSVIFLCRWERSVIKLDGFKCIKWMNKSEVCTAAALGMKHDEKLFLQKNLDYLFKQIADFDTGMTEMSLANKEAPIKVTLPAKSIRFIDCNIMNKLRVIDTISTAPSLPRLSNAFNAVWARNESNALNMLLDYLYDNWVAITNTENTTINALNTVIESINNPPDVVTYNFSQLAINRITGLPGGIPIVSLSGSGVTMLSIPIGKYCLTAHYAVECTVALSGTNSIVLTYNATTQEYHNDETYNALITKKHYTAWFNFEMLTQGNVDLTALTTISSPNTTTTLFDMILTTNS